MPTSLLFPTHCHPGRRSCHHHRGKTAAVQRFAGTLKAAGRSCFHRSCSHPCRPPSAQLAVLALDSLVPVQVVRLMSTSLDDGMGRLFQVGNMTFVVA